MTSTTLTPATGERTYTTEQAAARDYMQAENALKALKVQAKPFEQAKAAALNTLKVAHPAQRNHDNALHVITGCWNRALTFLHRTDDSTKWQKVAEGILPHLDGRQQELWQNLRDANTGERTTATLK